MIELFIIVLMGLAMARHPKKRRYTLRAVKATPTITIGALAPATAVTGVFWGNADGAYRVVSVSGTWNLSDFTAGDGPLVVGFAHGDYTVAEIKENLESASSINIGNKVENERANRLIRKVGTFPGLAAQEVLNNGLPIKTRLNWAIPIGTNLNIFAYNDDATINTTGAFAKFNGTGWVKDY